VARVRTQEGPRTEEAVADATGPPARRRLTVLVVGTEDWAAEQSAKVLQSQGHRVLLCHEPGEPAFPCNALIPGRTCPLDMGFDVVLTARARPTPVPTAGEMGVICALHDGAPLVSAGIAQKNPFTPWSTAMVGADGDMAEACQAAVADRTFDLRRDRR
jgi:hypothetical protein